MSYWCEKCNRLNYGDDKCDFCGHTKKDSLKNWDIPKPKQARILKSKEKKTNMKLNNNKIITIAIVIIAIAVSYLAINKLTEDTPQEKALKTIYGTSDPKEIKNINNEIIKESEKAIEEAGKKQIELYNNILAK